ncbi:MAG: hypothetical protein RLZ53_625 [Actinomycetota bacterium]
MSFNFDYAVLLLKELKSAKKALKRDIDGAKLRKNLIKIRKAQIGLLILGYDYVCAPIIFATFAIWSSHFWEFVGDFGWWATIILIELVSYILFKLLVLRFMRTSYYQPKFSEFW